MRAIDLLNDKKQAFERIDITGNESLRNEMMNKAGRHTVPQIFINGHHVGGCDDLFALEYDGRLDKLLQNEN